MRPIDADELKTKKRYSTEFHENVVAVAEIDWMPTIDAVPVVHAYWTTKRTWQHDGEIYCSACNHDSPTELKTNYCPFCGARMDGKEK